MGKSAPSGEIVRFADFEVDNREKELRRRGLRINLQEQPFEVLSLLLSRPGELVTRDELCSRLWPEEEFGDLDHRLNIALNKVRLALRDSAGSPRFIETVPRYGYRFIAPIHRPDDSSTRTQSRATTRVLLWSATVAVTLAVGVLVLRRPSTLGEVPKPIRIAVLPFENLSGDSDQDYLSDGFTVELITELGKMSSDRLAVVARTSVMPYKQTRKTVDEISRELAADYLLEGSVRREEDNVRISAQLIQPVTGTQLWAEGYGAELDSILEVQNKIAKLVVNSLVTELLPSPKPEPQKTNSVAYEAYLKGRYFRDAQTEESFRKSVDYFRQAIQADPAYAPAYAGLASCHCLLAGHGLEVVRPVDAMPAAKQAALKSLELDQTLAESHGVLGMVAFKYEWEFSAAEQSFRKAIELNPSDAQVRLWYSIFLEAMGRFDESLAQARSGRDLDPLSLQANVNLGMQLLQANRGEEARQQIEETLVLNPSFWGAHWALGNYYREQALYDKAIKEFAVAVDLSDRNSVSMASLGYAYATAGLKSEASGVLAELKAMGKQRYVSPAFLASIHAGLGEKDQAFDWLEKAFEQRSRYLAWLKVAPEFKSLRSDPRYRRLLGRIGLADSADRT